MKMLQNIVRGLLAVSFAAGLAYCMRAEAQPAPARISGVVAIVIVNPPQPVRCDQRGWSMTYIPSGAVYRVRSASYATGSRVLEIVPAVELCVHRDGFEVRA